VLLPLDFYHLVLLPLDFFQRLARVLPEQELAMGSAGVPQQEMAVRDKQHNL
jgi:hypothetical protein